MPVGGSVPSQLPTAAQAAAAYAEPPAKRLKAADLPGTVRGMTTYGLGRDRQLQWDLKHKACCTCQAKGKAATHAGGCEHGILLAAKKSNGFDTSGKKKR